MRRGIVEIAFLGLSVAGSRSQESGVRNQESGVRKEGNGPVFFTDC
jgi:hypothetical protein